MNAFCLPRIVAGILLAAVVGGTATARPEPHCHPSPVKENLRVSAPAAAEPIELSAGPLRCTFADGELRYLYVGDREVVRRVYFAVRDKDWNTALPHFTKMEIHRTGDDGFTIDLAADCRTDSADFSWTGRIEGKSDGTITFHAGGAANRAFRSNRIGLCILYGSPALAGAAYETVGLDGHTTARTFPAYVSAPLVAPDYRILRYTTPDNLTVATEATGSAHFDMEDQRTYSDSSFKAYAPLGYDYKQDIPQGTRLEETVTIHTGRAAVPPRTSDIRVTLGSAAATGKIPNITQAAADAKPGLFGDVNGRADQFKGAASLTWGFNPAVHLPDENTLFENVLSVGDQVRSAHAFAPGATITLSPVLLAQPSRWPDIYTHNGEDPLQGAWSAALIKQAALAGVDELAFGLGEGLGRMVQNDLATFAGRPLRTAVIRGPLPSPVEVLAVEADGGRPVVWLINQTRRPQRVTLDGLPTGKTELRRVNRAAIAGALPPDAAAQNGSLVVDLAPYEVCRVTIAGS